MRALTMIAMLTLLGLGTAPRAQAQATERIWEGYLWRDGQGRIRLGWPVISMGVIAQPAYVVLAPRLAPLLSAMKHDYTFWNYTLERSDAQALPLLPKLLVRLKGAVTPTAGGGLGRGGDKTMRAVRLLGAERVEDAWLTAWAPVFREPWSPWRIRERPAGDADAGARALAPRLAVALTRMRAVPGPTAEQRRWLKQIDPGAALESRFRQEQEIALLRWLTTTNKRHRLGLDLSRLGRVPPTSVALQRMFLRAASRRAFLDAVKAAWDGDPGLLRLSYYRPRRNGVTIASAGIDDVAGHWTDAEFARFQTATRGVLAR